jgi:hypothetical protein
MGATQRSGIVVCSRNMRSNRHSDAHRNPKANGYTNDNTEADRDANGYSETDSNTDRHCHGNSETNSNADCDSETDSNSDRHCHRDSKTNGHTNGDGHGNTERKLRAGLGSRSYLRNRSDGQLSGCEL